MSIFAPTKNRKAVPVQIDKAEQKLNVFISDAISDYKSARYELNKQYVVNRFNLLGFQWYEWSEKTQRMVMVKNAPHRRRPVFNLILPKYVSLVSSVVDAEYVLSVTPTNKQTENVQRSIITESVGNDILRKNNISEGFIEDMVAEAATTGAFYFSVVWDQNMGPSKEFEFTDIEMVEDENGEMVESANKRIETERIGDVRFIPYFSSELIFPSRAKTWDEVMKSYYIIHKNMPAGEALHLYKLKELPGSSTTGTTGGLNVTDDRAMDVLNQVQSTTKSRSQAPKAQSHVDVYELWHYPSREYPKGKQCVQINGRIVLDLELPRWCIDEDGNYALPLCRTPFYAIRGRLQPMSFIQPLIDWQRTYNELMANAMENLMLAAGGKLLLEQGSLVGNQQITKEPFQVITLKRTTQRQPSFIAPPPVSSSNFNMQDRIKAIGDDISNLRGISGGNVPSGITSGRAIESLAELDEQDLGIIKKHIEQSMVGAIRKALNVARVEYTDPRMIAVMGKTEFEEVNVEGRDINTKDEVTFSFGVGLPKSKFGKATFLIEMVKSGIISREQAQKKLGEFNITEIRDEDMALDEAQSKRHIEYLLAGNINKAIPTEYENHAFHFRYETNFTKRREFEDIRASDPETADAIMLHIQQHQNMLTGAPGLAGINAMQNSGQELDKLQNQPMPQGDRKNITQMPGDAGQAKSQMMGGM